MGNFSVSDEDRLQTHAYQLLDLATTDGDKFEIRNVNSLFLRLPIAADYETQSMLYIRVRALDDGTPVPQFVDSVIGIRVLNVNERPSAVVLIPNATLPGESRDGSPVSIVFASRN